MKIGVVVFLIALVSPAVADQCDELAADVIAHVPGLSFDRKGLSGQTIFFKGVPGSDFNIDCQQPPALSAGWNGGYPPFEFFRMLGEAGSVVTHASADTVREGALACHKRALATQSQNIDFRAAGLKFECSAIAGNQGGADITVYREK
jgi:hypothetical protein